MEGLEQAAALLQERAQLPLSWTPTFVPLQRSLSPDASAHSACVAVDGSRAVLWDNGAVWVVAHRAVALSWPGPRPVVHPEFTAVLADDAQVHVDGLYEPDGLDAPRVRTSEAFAEAVAGLAEHRMALTAITNARQRSKMGAARTGLVLLDGSLYGLPPGSADLAERLVVAAQEAGVNLVAIAKRNGLSENGTAIVAAVARSAPAGTWMSDVPHRPGVHVARFHAASPHAFRVDVVTSGEETPMDLLQSILPLCADAATPGYPYPLVAAHNAVALTGSTVAELRGRFEAQVRRRGPEAWGLLRDFHHMLDSGVPGGT